MMRAGIAILMLAVSGGVALAQGGPSTAQKAPEPLINPTAPPAPSSASPQPTSGIKSTPASDALTAAAKEMSETQKALNTAVQQAKSGFDLSQKQLIDTLTAKQKELSDELKNDKKYAPKIKEIETIQQQSKDAASHAEQQFQATAGPLQQKIATDNALIQGLIPIVRKENGLPETETFDVETQTWKGGK